MKVQFISLILTTLFILGCTERADVDIKKGNLRHTLFVECMELSAKMPRQSDDDVSDIVSECSSQSWYMANQMSK